MREKSVPSILEPSLQMMLKKGVVGISGTGTHLETLLTQGSITLHSSPFSFMVSLPDCMKFSDLTDEQWKLVEPYLPPRARTGRPRNDDRSTINGILYILITGCRWMDMPGKYGSYKTVWERHKKWSENGTWKRIMDSLVAKGYSEGKVNVDSLSIDSSTVPAKKGERWLALMVTGESRERRFMP